ncbi:MAG: glycosyltransferase [Burkholderiaceae bacterium]|nr:glycosyltransferase [Burkholderiaceae bacterium]
MTALIVFSHLRWGFAYQRPQHLMAALAQHLPVLFVEEPVRTSGPARLECRTLGPRLQVLVPHTPLPQVGFHGEQLPLLRRLLDAHLNGLGLADIGVWFYTPLALPLAASWRPRVVVYDCMDELSGLQNAPPLLRQREAALLQRADIVLTSGPSLYEAKRALHPNVHYLPSTVDAEHFAPHELAVNDAEAIAAARLMQPVARPRLGYFGLIDERIDFELIDALAAMRRDWQLVMVGPVVRADRRSVPHRPNIHWLGPQPYQRLPHLLAAWDVALMPFAINDITRFVHPSKALEYMAGEKPVVSTPLPDVVSLYGDLVRTARRPREFAEACAAALAETPWQRSERLVRAAATVYRTSWKEHARQVRALLGEHLARMDETEPSTVQEGAMLVAPALRRWGV